MITQTVKNTLSQEILNILNTCDEQTQNRFVQEYTLLHKSNTLGLILCFIGWHYVYINNFPRQLGFWCTLGGLGVWSLIDLLMIKKIIRNANNRIAKSILQTLV